MPHRQSLGLAAIFIATLNQDIQGIGIHCAHMGTCILCEPCLCIKNVDVDGEIHLQYN